MDRRDAIKGIGATLGWVLCPSIATGVLSGCESAFRGGYQLRTLPPEQDAMVRTLVDLIIPPTDTPGAAEANVNQFIDLMLTRYLEDEEKEVFVSGLEALNERSQNSFGSLFEEISHERQVQLLKETEDEMTAMRRQGNRGPAFFRLLKELTITGYYTSEIGASQELRYIHVAGRYDGDVPYNEIGRAYF